MTRGKTNKLAFWPVAAAAALVGGSVLGGCDSTSEPVEPVGTEDEALTSPFSVAARISGASVAEVTAALSQTIHGVDDTTRGLPGDWKVAGAGDIEPGAPPTEAALKLPDGNRVIEVCNHHYAEQAMAFGGHHGVALPCEIGVVQQGDDVEVVLLNPEAIFGVFFQDVPAEHAAGMASLAATVRGELEELVELGAEGFAADFPGEDVGPSWTNEELSEFAAMDQSVELDIVIPASYRQQDGGAESFKQHFVGVLLETLTHEHMDEVGARLPGLSVEDWRAARPYPLALPGGVSVVEMCSPTYAQAAMSTGAHHAPALP